VTENYGINKPLEDEDESLFAELQAEANKPVEREPLLLRVEGRPSWAVEYSGDLTFKELKRLTKRASYKVSGKETELDPVKLSALTVVSMNTRLARVTKDTGELVKYYQDSDGDDVSLTSEPFLKAFSGEGNMDTVTAVVRFLGEAGVNQHGAAVLTWLGLDGSAEQLNPTNG